MTNHPNRSKQQMIRASQTEIAWAAGLFEGEGWICLHRRKERRSADLRVGMTNTEIILLESLRDIFGGSIRPRAGTALSHKPLFEWSLTTRPATAFLRIIFPYLKGAKRAKAALAIDHSNKVAARVRINGGNGRFSWTGERI